MSDLTLVPTKFKAVTPSDSVSVGPTLGLYVGNGGNVAVTGEDGVSATFVCNSGQYLTGRFALVKSTGTTATNIVALFA